MTQCDNSNIHGTQAEVNDYLDRCQKAFRGDTAAAERLRRQLAEEDLIWFPGLSTRWRQDTPRSLGMLVSDDIPPVLKRWWVKGKYKHGEYVVYPYTYGGHLVAFRVQNFNGRARRIDEYVVAREDVGVFLEDNLRPEDDEIYVAASEAAACMLCRLFSSRSSKRLPIIALKELPLPSAYRQLQRLCLISSPEGPLTLRQALEYYAAKSVVEGLPRRPSIGVYESKHALKNKDPGELLRHIRDVDQNRLSLAKWILTKVQDHMADKNDAAVVAAFDRVVLTTEQKDALLLKADKLKIPKKVTSLIEHADSSRHGRYILGDGKVVHCRPSGFYGVTRSGEEVTLSNAVISVRECAHNRNKDITYLCEIQTVDKSYTVRVPEINGQTGKRLTTTVSHAIAAQDQKATYLKFYDKAGYEWGDILAKLAVGKTVRPEVEKLGVSPDLLLHMPNFAFVLDPRDPKVLAQNQVDAFPQRVLQIYQGIRPPTGAADCKEVFRKFVKMAENNIYVAGLLVGIGHLVHQLRVGYICACKENPPPPPVRHLLYVEPQDNLWLPVFEQLTWLFGGGSTLPQIPTQGMRQHLEGMKQLGNLPYVASTTGVPAKRMRELVSSSPVSLVSRIDAVAAGVATPDPDTSFVIVTDYTRQEMVRLSSEDAVALQEALASFLLEVMLLPPTQEERRQLGSASTAPAIMGYRSICRALQIKPALRVEKLVMNFYGPLTTGALGFLNEVYYLLYSKDEGLTYRQRLKLGLRDVRGRPSVADLQDPNPPQVFRMKEKGIVAASKQLVPLVNKYTREPGVFSTEGLTEEFDARGWTRPCPKDLNIDENRYWVLDIDKWESYAMKNALVLRKQVTQDNVTLRIA